MGLFGNKGKSRDELIAEAAELNEADVQEEKKDDISTGNPKIDIEITKIKAQLEGFAEVRKSNSERFSRISEQLGELRGMIVDANKAMGKVEVVATKATDLVESVHPEKLMIEIRKQDGKIESVRAMIESNEAIMKNMMEEMRGMREQMNFYKGMEQVVKLNEEVKQELASIKKMEAVVERHADRVETIFLEVEKKFTSFEKYEITVKELQEGFKKLTGEFEKIKAKIALKEDKKEFVDLLDKFNDFEKHTTNLLQLLDDRSKIVKRELESDFKKLRKDLLHDAAKDKKKKKETPEETAEDQDGTEPEAPTQETPATGAAENEEGLKPAEEKKEETPAATEDKSSEEPAPSKTSRFIGRFKKK